MAKALPPLLRAPLMTQSCLSSTSSILSTKSKAFIPMVERNWKLLRIRIIGLTRHLHHTFMKPTVLLNAASDKLKLVQGHICRKVGCQHCGGPGQAHTSVLPLRPTSLVVKVLILRNMGTAVRLSKSPLVHSSNSCLPQRKICG